MRTVAAAVLAVGLLVGCGAGDHEPAGRGLTVTMSTTATTLPALPAAGVVVETEGGVDLLGLDGGAVTSLAGYRLGRDAGTNALVHDPEGVRLLSPTGEITHLSTVEPTIERTDAPVDPAAPDGLVHGHWAGQFRSPDGRTLLGAWSGECESPSVWLAEGDGPWRPIVPRPGDDGFPPESATVGWAPDGRAVVYFTEGVCGTGIGRPGTYLVTTTGTTTLLTEQPVAVLWRS
jgi:hypothetical protein